MGTRMSFRRFFRDSTPTFCFVCGVDSTEIKIFLFFVIGSLVATSLCIGLWSFFTGRLKDHSELRSLPITADRREEILK